LKMLRAWSTLLGISAAIGLQSAIKTHPPSTFTPPAIFEHVCITRLDRDTPPKLLFATDTSASNSELSSQTRTSTAPRPPSYVNLLPRRQKKSRPSRKALIEVEQIDIESVYSLSLGDLLNMSLVAELKFIGGTLYLVQTPCDSGYAENYFNALTEEGPLLDIITDAVPRKHGEQGTFLFTNECRHALYRDDIRMLLLGRRHGVAKVTPGAIICAKRLITAEIMVVQASEAQERPPPPVGARLGPRAFRDDWKGVDTKRRGEFSLQSYVERLKAAAKQMAHEAHICDPAPVNGAELTRFGEAHEACFDGHGSSVDKETGASPSSMWPTSAGLRVLLVQRTRNRRIRNMDTLEKTLRQAFREVTFPKDVSRTTMDLHGATELRDAVVQVIFFEEMSLIQQINLMQQVDVLIGVTGSALSNLAFMRPGSVVVELSSPHHVPDFFPLLISRVHGRLARGVVSYKRLLFEPMNVSTADLGDSVTPPKPSDLDAHVDVEAVADAVLTEFKARITGMAI